VRGPATGLPLQLAVTTSGANTASRTILVYCGGRCASSPRPACVPPGCPASATTRPSTRA
jgi:hypothetical protein